MYGLYLKQTGHPAFFRCTNKVIPASAASRARRCRSIPRIRGSGRWAGRSSNAASTFRAVEMIFALGFVIALAIGITGVGGGTITVPVLMLFVHLAPDKTVGTALAICGRGQVAGRSGLCDPETGGLSNFRFDGAGRFARAFCWTLFSASVAFVESERAAYGFVGDCHCVHGGSESPACQ